MSGPEKQIVLKEMIKSPTDNQNKKGTEYTPVDSTESEEQRKQENEDKKATLESIQLDQLFKKYENDFNWLNEIRQSFKRESNKGATFLKQFLSSRATKENLDFEIPVDLFIKKLNEANKERLTNAINGLKNLSGQDILTMLNTPTSDFAQTMIKKLFIDGKEEYDDLLKKNPDIVAGRQEKVAANTISQSLNTETILTNVTNKQSPEYTFNIGLKSKFGDIIVSIKDIISKDNGIVNNPQFKQLVTALTTGNFKEFQKLVYFQGLQKISTKYGDNWNDGKLGEESLEKTKKYLNVLLGRVQDQKLPSIDKVISKEAPNNVEYTGNNSQTKEEMNKILIAWPIGKSITLGYENEASIIGKITSIDGNTLVVAPDNDPTATIITSIKEITADKIVIYREGGKTYTITNNIPAGDQLLNVNITKPSGSKNINYSKITQAPMA